MNLRVLFAVAFLTCGSPAVALGQVKLAWKLKEGDTFFVRQQLDVTHTGTFGTEKQKLRYEQTLLTRLRVVKMHADGTATLEQEIVSAAIHTPGHVAGDATKQMIQTLRGASFRFDVTAGGTVRQVEGFEDWLQKATGGDSKKAAALKQLLTPAHLKERVAPLFDFLPPGEVKPGGSWQAAQRIDVGLHGAVNVAYRFTFSQEVKDKGTVRLVGAGKVAYEKPAQPVLAHLEVQEGALEKGAAECDVLFDAAKGRLRRRTDRHEWKLRVELSTGRRRIPQVVETQRTFTLEVFDNDPRK